MIAAALAPLVLNAIPPSARAGLTKGTLKLTGSVIRRLDGKIFCHLQEAGPLTKLAGSSLRKGLASAPAVGPQGAVALAAADFAVGAATLAEADVTRRGVARVEEAVSRVESQLAGVSGQLHAVEQIGITNLALNAAGIGISVAGFAMLSLKIDRVQQSIHSMGSTLDIISQKIDQVRQDQLDRDFIQLRTLASLFDEAWELTDIGRAEQQWMRVAQDARTYQDRFANYARDLLTTGPGSYPAADPALDALALISGLRVAALAACNEPLLARSVALASSSQIDQLSGGIGLADLALRSLPDDVEPGSTQWQVAVAECSQRARPIVQRMREREALAATRAAPLELLESNGIAPREWLERARYETDSPVLVLLEGPAGDPEP